MIIVTVVQFLLQRVAPHRKAVGETEYEILVAPGAPDQAAAVPHHQPELRIKVEGALDEPARPPQQKPYRQKIKAGTVFY